MIIAAMRRALLLLSFFAAAARADQIQAVHRVESVDEDGMRGTREEWVTSALQRREHVMHEHDETTVVYDGTSGWRRDWNGFVETLAGDDLRRQRNIALLHSLAPLTGDSGEVKVTVDPATGRPSRATMPSFDGVMTVAFDDWRDVDGHPVAFTETWSTGPNVITAVDAVPAAQLDLASVRRIFSADGSRHDVAVQRGSQELTLHATVATKPISGL